MRRFSVALETYAYYERVVAIPRSDAVTDLDSAYESACAAGHKVDLGIAPWCVDEDQVKAHYGSPEDYTPADDHTHIHVRITARVSAGHSITVNAKDGDDACNRVHDENEADSPWPREYEGWRLCCRGEVEAFDPEERSPATPSSRKTPSPRTSARA